MARASAPAPRARAFGGWVDVAFASLGQAASASGFGIVVASLAVATEANTGSKTLGTLSLAFEFLARSVVGVPAARWASRRGRRVVIAASGLVGAAGASLVAWDLHLGTLILGCVGVAGVGVANCVAQQFRFLAAESVTPNHRARALSLGVAGGVVAAFAGPEIAKATRDAGSVEFAASFLAMAACYASQTAFALAVSRDDPVEVADPDAAHSASLSLRAIFRRSREARKGASCVAVAWTAMFLVMSAAPLAITGGDEGGHSFDRSATALQYHLIAMFAPGLFGAGDAVRRFGADAVASAGCALYLACAFMTYSYAADRDAAGRYPARTFEDVLIVLGVAWNLTFVAGSAMLVPRAGGEEGGQDRGCD